MAHELRPGKDLAWDAHECLEKGELLGPQVDRRSSATDPSGRGVQPEVADGEHNRSFSAAAAHERAQTSQQFGEREGLGEIVVAPTSRRLPDPERSPWR